MIGFDGFVEQPMQTIWAHKHPRKYMYLIIDGISYKPVSMSGVEENPQDFTRFSSKLTLPRLRVKVDLSKYVLKFTEAQLVEFSIVTVDWKTGRLPHKNFRHFNAYYTGDEGRESTFLVSGSITWS